METLKDLEKAILEYDSEAATGCARRAIEEGVEPTKVIDALTAAIRQVGDGFAREELWLPDLVGAADTMLAASRQRRHWSV